MNFIERHKSKLLILYIVFLFLFLVWDPFYILKIEYASFLIIFVHVVAIYIYRDIINKKREADLEEYAEKNNFDLCKYGFFN